jgi:hypothetical protein
MLKHTHQQLVLNDGDGQFTNYEENKTPFPVHRNKQIPITDYENTPLCTMTIV